jgi:RNA polymerase sigma-70 factor (ECF subfamily)
MAVVVAPPFAGFGLGPEALLRRFGQLLAALEQSPPPAPDALEPATGRLNQRDPGSWHALFDAEMPAIYRYTRARVADHETAEDLTGEVFEEAWKHAGSYVDRGLPPRAWLFGIARNVVASHRRRWFRRPPHLSLEAFDGPANEGLSPEMTDLAGAMQKLPGNQAEVVALRFVHGLSLEETAEAMNASIDSVKARQARALARLRELCAVI